MSIIKKQIDDLKKEFLQNLENAKTEQDLEALRVQYLGRTGKITDLMQLLKSFSLEEKKEFGPMLNELKAELTAEFNSQKEKLYKIKLDQENYKQKYFDVTAYKKLFSPGTLHPYTQVLDQIEDIFISMGFAIADGPEVETEYHNFDALNIPKDHPARDMQDTFWLTTPNLLMRTHTSNVEIHELLKHKPPFAIIAPGRTYRNEATDASHDFMFMQVEGLLIDKNISVSNLLATIKTFFQALFNRKDLNIRIRPSYFPFVEPGVEVDITCPFCTAGCSTCKYSEWIEMGGAGLTHPNVLKAVNIDSKQYSAFAFGFGLTRLVMIKYGIPDIRLLHSNRIDFLKQF